MVRAFIGIDLESHLRESIASKVKGLQEEFPSLKWVHHTNYHLTLTFLGDVDKRMLEVIKKNLLTVASETRAIPITYAELGAFPDSRNPKVLWIGVKEGARELKQLHQRMEERLWDLGFPKERRPYHPHLTLARCRNTRLKGLEERIERFTPEELPSIVDNITLFKSRLTPKGPVYSRLQSIKLDSIKE